MADDNVGSADKRTLLAVLKHPLRVLILEVANEQAMSPTQFVDRGYVPAKMFKERSLAVSRVSFHFRELVRAGCLELIESIPRRGATEHLYRGTARLCFEGDVDRLSFEERQHLSTHCFLGLAARTERAIRLGTFDRRANRHLSWQTGTLDPKGFEELVKILAEASAKAERAREEATSRLANAVDGERIPVTYLLVAYESPNLPTGDR